MFCKGNIIDASKAGLLKIVAYFINNGTNFNDVKKDGKFVYFNVYGVNTKQQLSKCQNYNTVTVTKNNYVVISLIYYSNKRKQMNYTLNI